MLKVFTVIIMNKNNIFEALRGENRLSGAALFKAFLEGKSKADILHNSLLSPFLQFIRTEAGRIREREIPVLPWSLFSLFDSCGNRLQYEEKYFDRRRRFTTLALASWLWEHPEDLRALEDCIWAICEEYTWCLPAHLGGASLRAESAEANRLVLDLFACETGFALAEGCAMLESVLAPAVRERAYTEVRRRVTANFLASPVSWNWELMENNWCAVCAGSIACAALYVEEDDVSRADILSRLMPVFDRYVGSFHIQGQPR